MRDYGAGILADQNQAQIIWCVLRYQGRKHYIIHSVLTHKSLSMSINLGINGSPSELKLQLQPLSFKCKNLSILGN